MGSSQKRRVGRTVFVTGTSTGEGKTLMTGLLLLWLRRRRRRALAMKPFCAGRRTDARLFYRLQDGELSIDEVNPYYFHEPVAPLVAARMNHRRIELSDVIEKIQNLKRRCDCLLIEGVGGLYAPLGDGYTAAEIIAASADAALVVARNRLGAINHTLLTVKALQLAGVKTIVAVLMNRKRPDIASQTNAPALAELLAPIKVFTVPYLGPRAASSGAIEINAKKIQKTLALVLDVVKLMEASPEEKERRQ